MVYWRSNKGDAMPKRLKRPAGLVGTSGLAAAIISQAVSDALTGDRDNMLDAWAYLGSDWYRWKADVLGIPPDAWPVALEHTSVSEALAGMETKKARQLLDYPD
jgi:hypothetical protein